MKKDIHSTKQKIKSLLDELLNKNLSDEQRTKIALQIDNLSPDPLWSDYIFWSDDYLNEDTSINFEKLFETIFQEQSKHKQT